jgi:hypothetical protein
MATFEINGSTYELPDSLQGEALTSTLQKLSGMGTSSQPTASPTPAPPPANPKVLSYLDETDRILGLPPGTSAAQIKQESRFNPNAKSKAGAEGLAQVMPATRQSLEKKFGRTFDPYNESDSLFMHREVMRENIKKFQNSEDALKAYNAGWDKAKWNNPETNNYVAKITGKPSAIAQTTQATSPTAPYKPFAKVREDIDPATLNDDYDWLMASKRVYQMVENKPWEGSNTDLAEWGKDRLGWFNSNIPAMSFQAGQIAKYGSQEDKEAFVYMLDTYDNTNFSGEGFQRWSKGVLADPTTYVGLGTLGIGKWVAGAALKASAKKLLLESLGRTGIVAGIEGGIYSATDDAIRQGVRIDAGAQEQFSGLELAASTGVGVLGGVVLGTAADAATTKISGLIRDFKKPTSTNAPEPTITPDPIVTPQETPIVSPRASEVPPVRSEGLTPNSTPDSTPNSTPRVGDEAPLGSTLTPEEIAQATAREQPGRRAEDDIIPKFPEDAPAPKVDVPEMNTGLRSTPMSMEELTSLGGKVHDQLKELNNGDLAKVLENFRTASMPLEQSRIVARGVQMAADDIRIQKAELLKAINKDPNAPNAAELIAKLEELDQRLVPIDLADEAFGSIAGSILRQRQEGLPGLQGVSVESIMRDTGVTRPEAELAYIKQVDEAQTDAAAQKVSAEYESQYLEQLDKGDIVKAGQIAALKHRHLESLADAKAKGSGSFMQKLTELAISNVFTVKTVMINLIPSAMKTITVPALRLMLTNPLVKANRVQASATYGAMAGMTRGALNGALASFRYEQSILTRDGSRLLEGELAISGKKGGIIRFFPRILNATDEFLSQINYAGYIAGREGALAAADAAEKGLKGADLDKFVKDRVSKAIEDSLKPGESENLIRPIINKGVNLGYTGEKLAAYVEREAVRNPAALRHGSDEEALNYARDVLYKRRFSGDGQASKLAQGYERMTNAIPSLKFIFGQLFFRTPIRVFEEGVRLTPGLQILAPKFLTDLAGKNGQLRQVRAQGEALTSLAITGAVLTLYGQGRITGDGAYEDWRQQRARGDTAKAPPYTIKMSDGSYWSYRNFDPIATPVKIMLNGLERFEKLNIRMAQGEFVNKSEFDHAMAYLTVGTTAIAQSIRDANLVAGINTTFKFAENLADPEAKEDAIVKLFGEKLSLLVPNTLHKIAKENDPRITDPKTFWQVVEERLKSVGFDRDDVKTSYAYDALGNLRSMSDTDSLWNVFGTTDVAEMVKGRSEKELYVLQELDRLSRTTGASFNAPFKMVDTGDLDYRTVLTKDGSQTLYDKWMTNYKKLKPEDALAPLLAAPVPEGTFKYKGEKIEETRKIMKDYYEAAYFQMMAEEGQVIDRMITEELTKAKAQAGQFDFRPQ